MGAALYRPSRWQGFREDVRYTGHWDQSEVGLIYFGARYYAPQIGRWISADPLTIHGLGGDGNPYAFVGGSPMANVDPFGLQATDSSGNQVEGEDPPGAGEYSSLGPLPPPVTGCLGTECTAPGADNQGSNAIDAANAANVAGASMERYQAAGEEASSSLADATGLSGAGASYTTPLGIASALASAMTPGGIAPNLVGPMSSRAATALAGAFLIVNGVADVIAGIGGGTGSVMAAPFSVGTSLVGVPVAVAVAAAGATQVIAGVTAVMMAVNGQLDMGKQGKHIPGHNNYIPGRSILRSDPTKLAAKVGTGRQIGSIPIGQAGSKEWINLGRSSAIMSSIQMATRRLRQTASCITRRTASTSCRRPHEYL